MLWEACLGQNSEENQHLMLREEVKDERWLGRCTQRGWKNEMRRECGVMEGK